ncbi:epoxide hydrolase 3-like [Bidens hawaiensis]|uniref:epoxide hydrolase 3-like n=1 Tax=Bidens hawaiensis TaxID=980011 RepID=UPI00404B8E53
MDSIEHRTVRVNGTNMHVAEKGTGHVVLFLHGFPELWYTWRHQIQAVSEQGYHAVAPDLRGYGDTDSLVGDVVALIDSLGEEQVYLVATDWGAMVGWYLCLFRPDKVKAYVCMSVAYSPRQTWKKPVEALESVFGDDFYICRFQEPGVMEAEIKSYGTEHVLLSIYNETRPGPIRLPKSEPFGSENAPSPLPHWLSEEDLNYNVQKFQQKGFTGPLNYYRAIDMNWELTAAWAGVQIRVPVIYVVGEKDPVYTTPGAKTYVHGSGFKTDVPLLRQVVVLEDTGHFLNQEKPQKINDIILDFIKNF